MPTYNLQYGAGSSKSPSGQLQVSGTSAATATFQVRPNANATWQTITGPTYTALGGGTPSTPVAGDTLSMGTGAVNGHTFQGSATYSTSRTPNGYYAGASITADPGDWDAADDGSGKP